MIAVTDKFIPYLAEVLAPYFEVRALSGSEISSLSVIDADVLVVRTRTKCNRALLEDSTVQFVGTATIGYDHIDREYLASRSIEFASAAGCNARAVLQWVGGVLAFMATREGWRPDERTLGVVGVGHVGTLVAEYARSWGFRVMCSDPPREEAEKLGRAEGFYPLDEIARKADIVTFHPLLMSQGAHPSYHLADARFLSSLRDGALLLNASRGEVVDNEALAAESERLNFAIDTWENEPNLNRVLLRSAAVATPHIAGYSVQGKANAAAMMATATGRHFGIGALQGWYPQGIAPSSPRPIGWDEMYSSIGQYFDPEAETAVLRERTGEFENLRNTYNLREEYF